MTTTGSARPTPVRPDAVRAVALVVGAIVVAVLLDTVISLVARAAGASDDFKPLQFPAYTGLTVIGMLAGTAGWALIRRVAAHPAGVLRRLVPTVLVVSFIPDIALLVGGEDGASVGSVLALVLMHVCVAAVLVTALRRALPVE